MARKVWLISFEALEGPARAAVWSESPEEALERFRDTAPVDVVAITKVERSEQGVNHER